MKFRLHPVLWVIYQFLRMISWISIHVFYRRRLVLGRENLRFDGPAIIISNHPSTLMDPLNVGIHVPRSMFFLANYSLFKHPVSNWLLSRLYCIPVKRKEDVEEGEDRNNDAAFEASFEHLEKGGILFIAAEGVSWMNRWVRPLKTGTARIALATEARNNWALDLKIIPVGLSYDTPNLFRSSMTLHAGTPVYARDWAEANAADHMAAVDNLTEHLENQLKALTIHTEDEAGEQFLSQVEKMLDNAQWASPSAWYARSKAVVKTHLHNAPLREKVAEYRAKLTKNGISDLGLAAFTAPHAVGKKWYDGLMLVAGLPFTVVGLAFWALPCYLPWLAAKKLKLYVGYDSNVKVLLGLFTFPLAIWGVFRLLDHFLHHDLYAWGGVLFLLLLGFHLEATGDIWRRFKARLKVGRLSPTVVADLQKQRSEILAHISN